MEFNGKYDSFQTLRFESTTKVQVGEIDTTNKIN